MNRKRRIAFVACRVVGIIGIAVAALPSILAGSIGWSASTVIAGIVVYYAGASMVLSLAEKSRGPDAGAR